MKTSLLVVLCAAAACAAATQDNGTRKKAFFKDVPRPAHSAQGHNLRIVNGDVAARSQFPFQAGIYINYSGFCGGSLIHPKWVLTAAHCVDQYTKWAVFLGLSSMLQAKEEGRIVLLSNWGKRHPDYDSELIINDIGVIQLPREVELNDYIGLSTLAPPNVNYAGRMATVSGFGLVDDDAPKVISPVLKYTSLPIVSSSVCYETYRSADVSTICLKAEGTSSCSGDSGGPLTLKDDDGALIQIGLTSFGCNTGCTVGCPVGFTRITMFYDWLSSTTGINFPL